MKSLIKIIVLWSVGISSFAFDTSSEIETLNKEYNKYGTHPIVIFDKEMIRSKLTESKEDNKIFIQNYMKERFEIKVSPLESENILDYHTILNNSASALPFRETGKKGYKFCAVFPSGANTNHEEEVKRILGIAGNINPYPEDTVEKVMRMISLKELKLISLYHELSHCLDKRYIPNIYDTSSHGIHMAESFAETLSIILVSKKFKFRNLALRRAILRGLYTRYMGEYIINDESTIVMHPSAKEMGGIYYLSPALLNINKSLSSYGFRTKEFTLDELNKLALDNTENFALESRTFAALLNFLKNGKNASLETYYDLAKNSPDLFYINYLNLKKEISFLEDISFLLKSF